MYLFQFNYTEVTQSNASYTIDENNLDYMRNHM